MFIQKEKIKIWLKENKEILLIILLAFILRIWGVTYGLPGLFIGDEKSLVGGALKMIYEKNIFPVLAPDNFRLLYYPVLIPWIYLIFFIPYLFFIYFTGDFSSFSEIKDYFTLNPEMFFLIARIINVFFSVATIYLIYLATKKIFSKRAGLLAALIYAVSWLPVHEGHFSKHWNLGGFLAFLILYFAFSILKNQSWRHYLLVGLAIGLAGFADYVYAIYGLVVALIHFFFINQNFKRQLLAWRFWAGVFIALAIFGLGVISYPQEFQRMFLGEDSTATAAKNLAGFWQVIQEIFLTLFHLETVLFILSVLGGLLLFFHQRKILFILLFLPFLSPFLYYFFLHFEERYLLLFLPFLGILAGYGLDKLLVLLKIKSTLIILAVILVVIFLPLKNAINFGMILNQTDTRLEARKWLENNIPAGAGIITNSWEFNLIRNQECIYDQQQLNNMSLRSRDYVLWQKEFSNSYCVWPIDLVLKPPPQLEKYQYYLVDSYTARRFAYLGDELLPQAKLIKQFTGSPFPLAEMPFRFFVHETLKIKKAGPTIWIYQLNFK